MTPSPSDPNGRTPPDGRSSGRESRPPGARADGEYSGVVVPPETSDERRSRRMHRLLLGTALAVIAVGGYYLWGGDVIERLGRLEGAIVGEVSGQFEPVSGSSTQQGNGRVFSGGAAAGDSAPSEGAQPGTSVDPPVRDFRARVEELMTAAERFGERSRDFRLGRIECSDLDEGYAAVDRAMVDMARSYLDAGSRLGQDDRELYRRAMDQADSIAGIFDRSGCDREL